jgi:hypothetical protein
VRDAFKAMPVKTDRKDARGIAQLMRLGWFRSVHCKSLPAQETRALLTARKLVQSKHHGTEMSLRGILRGVGVSLGNNHATEINAGDFEWGVAEVEAWWRVASHFSHADLPQSRSDRASLTELTMMMCDAPLAEATAAVVKARTTSMTATAPVACLAPSSRLPIDMRMP